MVRRMDLEGGVGNFRRELILNKEEQIAFILYFLNFPSKPPSREGKGKYN